MGVNNRRGRTHNPTPMTSTENLQTHKGTMERELAALYESITTIDRPIAWLRTCIGP